MSGNKQANAKSAIARRQPAGGSQPAKIDTESRIDRLLTHKYSDAVRSYLRGLVDPMSAERPPDVLTTVPTGLLRFEQVGTITSSAAGKFSCSFQPELTSSVLLGSTPVGSVEWGVANATSDTFCFNQAIQQLPNISAYRCVSFAVEITGNQSYNQATGQLGIAVIPYDGGLSSYWTVANMSQQPGGKVHTLTSMNVPEGAVHYYGTMYNNVQLATPPTSVGAVWGPNLFNSVTVLPAALPVQQTNMAPVIALAVEGAPANAPILQFTLRMAFEVIVKNNSIPTSSIRPHQAAADLGTMVGHPEVRTSLVRPKERNNFLQNAGKWLWTHRSQIAGGAEKVATAVAPLLPLLL